MKITDPDLMDEYITDAHLWLLNPDEDDRRMPAVLVMAGGSTEAQRLSAEYAVKMGHARYTPVRHDGPAPFQGAWVDAMATFAGEAGQQTVVLTVNGETTETPLPCLIEGDELLELRCVLGTHVASDPELGHLTDLLYASIPEEINIELFEEWCDVESARSRLYNQCRAKARDILGDHRGALGAAMGLHLQSFHPDLNPPDSRVSVDAPWPGKGTFTLTFVPDRQAAAV